MFFFVPSKKPPVSQFSRSVSRKAHACRQTAGCEGCTATRRGKIPRRVFVPQATPRPAGTSRATLYSVLHFYFLHCNTNRAGIQDPRAEKYQRSRKNIKDQNTALRFRRQCRAPWRRASPRPSGIRHPLPTCRADCRESGGNTRAAGKKPGCASRSACR